MKNYNPQLQIIPKNGWIINVLKLFNSLEIIADTIYPNIKNLTENNFN